MKVESERDDELTAAPQGADEVPLVEAPAEVLSLAITEAEPPPPEQTTALMVAPPQLATTPGGISRRDFIKGGLALAAVAGSAYLLFGRGDSEGDAHQPSAEANAAPATTPTASVTNVPTPTASPVSAPAAGTVLYKSNWTNGDDGWAFPDGWGILNGVLAVPEASLAGGRPFLVVPIEPSHPDYAIEVEWRWFEDRGLGHILALVIRDRYLLTLDLNDGTEYSISKMRENFDQVVATSGAFTSDGTDTDLDNSVHTVRFEGKDRTLTAYLDGSIILQAIGDNDYAPGQVGLSAVRKAEIRSVRVVAT